MIGQCRPGPVVGRRVLWASVRLRPLQEMARPDAILTHDS